MKAVDKGILNQGLEKTGDDFTQRLENIGFKRTKKWYWVRLNKYYADFIHLHRHGSSYGPQINYSVSFRVYCGNRVLNDLEETLCLNGPNSDSPEAMERKYHLRFNARSGSTYDRCIDDLEKFVIEMGEPWFISHVPASAIEDEAKPENIKLSLKLLGIKGAQVGNF